MRVGKTHSKRDIRASAAIVRKATAQICEEVYIVSPELLDELDAPDG